MGAPRARVQLAGDRLDLEWPDLVSCAGLTAKCWLRDDTVHESASWAAVPTAANRYRTSCGPLDVEIELEPDDGCVRLRAEASATAGGEVARVGVGASVPGCAARTCWRTRTSWQSRRSATSATAWSRWTTAGRRRTASGARTRSSRAGWRR